MILSGIMMGSLFSALVSLVKFTADTESQLPAITYWLMGSLSAASFAALRLGAPAILLSCIVLLLLRWKLNLLPLSDEEARTFGTHMKSPARTLHRVLRGDDGLVRRDVRAGRLDRAFGAACVPDDFRQQSCAAAAGGNQLRSGIYDGGRHAGDGPISAAEIPVSILTAIIGAPIFIAIVRKKGGWSL